MATNYCPSPNMTASKTGWVTSNASLTTTSEGGRFRPAGGGFGSIVCQMDSFSTGPAIPTGTRLVLAGVQIRRNTAASGPLHSIEMRTFGSNGDGTWQSDTVAGISLAGTYFPVGQWVTLPNIKNPTRTMEHYNGEGRGMVALFSETAGDYTVRRFNVFRWEEEPADSVIDGSDAAWAYTAPVDALDVDFSYTASPNELVQTLIWDYGDGTTETGSASDASARARSHTYETAGTYNAKLTVRNYFTSTDGVLKVHHEHTVTKNVVVPSGVFQAGFTYQDSYLDLDVDASGSEFESWVDSYVWDFGDGTPTETGQYAQHSYAQGGAYTVTLTMTNTLGQSSTVSQVIVIEDAPNPSLYFVTDKNLLSVTFSPSVTNGSAYSWSFGDGSTSTEVAPTHVYETAGTYAVSLTVDGLSVSRDVLVVSEFTPVKSVFDTLRLEVELPPSEGLRNLLVNPSGEQGGYGWVTHSAGGTLYGSNTLDGPNDHGVEGWKLIMVAGGGESNVVTSEPYRVTVGEWIGLSWRMPFVDGYLRASVEFLDSSLAVIASGPQTGFLSAAGATLRTIPTQIPTGTVYARARFDHVADATESAPDAGDTVLVRYAMLATGETEDELDALSYSENNTWLNVLGPSREVRVNRNALDIGTLSATILDAELDPSTSEKLRPGQRVRLRAKTRDDAGGALWESLYRGEATTLNVSYDYGKRGTAKHARIELTAVDAIQALAAQTEPRGVPVIADLPFILEGKGVPYNVNGSSGQIPDAVVVSGNDNAALIDQIAITRDSELGYAWVDRNNVLTAFDRNNITPAQVAAFDESDYSGLDVSFSTDTCINDVRIKWLRQADAEGNSEEVTYGPYVDQASVDEWGRHSAEFTMHGAVENPATIAAKAADVLAYNGTPAVRINSVTLPIRYVEDVSTAKAVVDLYDLVSVSYAPTGTTEVSRVTGIEHQITSSGWTMTLTFERDGAVASPQVVPSPTSAAGTSTGTARAGVVEMFAGLDAPSGSLLCDGTVYAVSDFQGLFDVIGSRFGGDGVTTFAVPDMRTRFPVGAGSWRGVGAGDGLAESSRGAQMSHAHSHTISSDGAHNHSGSTGPGPQQRNANLGSGGNNDNYANHTHSISNDGAHTHGGSTGSAGSDAHPSLALNFIIWT